MSKTSVKWNGLSRLVVLGWVLLVGFLVFQWVLFATSTTRRPESLAQAVARVEKLEQEVRDKEIDDGPRIAALTKKSLFAPPAARPEPPKCAAILGDTVLINGEWHRVGQEVAGAKITAIDATSVTLMFNEREIRQYPFEAGGGGGEGGGRRGGRERGSRGARSRPEQASAGGGEMPPGPPGGFGRFFDMNPEQREQMRQGFEQMRQRYESMSPEERDAVRQQMREQFGNFRREN